MSSHQKTFPALTIKIATIEDIPLIRELSFNIWPQTYASILSKEQIEFMLEMMYKKENLLKQIKEECLYIIVFEKDVPVGFASYKKNDPLVYKLDKIYILKSQQGKGTGKFVLNYILAQIKNDGANSLQLQVNRSNIHAKSFYEKMGFSIIDEADFDIGNGYFMNDYIMEKKI